MNSSRRYSRRSQSCAKYEYFMAEDDIVIVDPWARRVMEVIT
jgi:hypothetical protein